MDIKKLLLYFIEVAQCYLSEYTIFLNEHKATLILKLIFQEIFKVYP